MKNNYTRRKFIANAGLAGVGLSILPSVTKAFGTTAKIIDYTQQPLGYAYNALEPAIDATTMEIHYSKHASTYAKNLADACVAENINKVQVPIKDLLKNISAYSAKVRNNGGGHFNHEFFWQCMKPGTASAPTGQLAKALEQSFGSVEAFKTQFADAAKNRFGSGWAWLVQTPDKKLVVSSTPNQDNPLMNIAEVKGTPLLGLDVWEHAYYLKYQNKRPDYITNWFNVVNWDFVGEQLVS